jgi:error-prone DNA polymerase
LCLVEWHADGIYQPAPVIIGKKSWSQMKPIDINHSHWDNTLEERGEYYAIRLDSDK